MLPRRKLLLIALSLPTRLMAQNVDPPANATFRIMARGFAEFANLKKIAIIRDGQRHDFNYRDFVKGGNTEQNILLQNGDVIEVP